MTELKKSKQCVFCDAIENNTNILFRNENLVIIKDIRPVSTHHYLAIPHRHINDVRCLTINDKALLLEMEETLKTYLMEQGIPLDVATFGFHHPPFITVQHLHMHGIAPISKMNFLSRWIFKPLNIWYCTPQYICENLKPEEKIPTNQLK